MPRPIARGFSAVTFVLASVACSQATVQLPLMANGGREDLISISAPPNVIVFPSTSGVTISLIRSASLLKARASWSMDVIICFRSICASWGYGSRREAVRPNEIF